MNTSAPQLQCRFLSSLEKVFCSDRLDAPELTGLEGVRGEVISFQLAFRYDEKRIYIHGCDVIAPPGVTSRVFRVGLVPCELPAVAEDPFTITSDPGLFPDPLPPLNRPFPAVRAKWNALWIALETDSSSRAGCAEIKLKLRWRPYVPSRPGLEAPEYEQLLSLPLTILPVELEAQKLMFANWFYADCLATAYHTGVWSALHWELLENYFRDMSSHGINMLYTPLWTVPLDTAIGAERPTAQLLIIRRDGGGEYSFDFSRLVRWLELGRRCGIEFFEFSHAFTQWGAGFTPKIMATREDGTEQRIFGWDVSSDSPEYEHFMQSLLPALCAKLRELGLEEKCRFHVSDEPAPEHLASYLKAAALLDRLTPGFVKMDALSSPEFYRAGATRCPIPNTLALDAFMTEHIPERWVYYCGNWQNGVPNRQFGMPSWRNRVLGVLLYVYDLDGFLNWGYNFWYSQLCRDTSIDPWHVTDAGRAFCGGGSFMVYPGADGRPVSSIHYEVFREGLQDMRLLRTLEHRIGRDATLDLIHAGLNSRLSMTNYPHDAGWLLDLRHRVLAALK